MRSYRTVKCNCHFLAYLNVYGHDWSITAIEAAYAGMAIEAAYAGHLAVMAEVSAILKVHTLSYPVQIILLTDIK